MTRLCARSSNFGDATREPQLYVFDVCLAKFGQHHEWMGLLDVDEYLVLQPGEPTRSLPEFLAGYAGFGGLVANWRVFGAPEPREKLKGSMLRTHVRCILWLDCEHSTLSLLPVVLAGLCSAQGRTWAPSDLVAFEHPSMLFLSQRFQAWIVCISVRRTMVYKRLLSACQVPARAARGEQARAHAGPHGSGACAAHADGARRQVQGGLLGCGRGQAACGRGAQHPQVRLHIRSDQRTWAWYILVWMCACFSWDVLGGVQGAGKQDCSAQVSSAWGSAGRVEGQGEEVGGEA